MLYIWGNRRVRSSVILAALLALSSSVIAGDEEHFAKVKKYSPAGSNVAFSFQPPKIIGAYSRLQPTIEGMPPIEEMLTSLSNLIQVDLTKARRVTYVGRQADSLFQTGGDVFPITAVTDFEGGIDLEKLAKEAPDYFEPILGSSRYKLTSPGGEVDALSIIAFKEGGSLIATNSIDNYSKDSWLALEELKKHVTPDNDFLLSMFTPKEFGEYLSSGIENFESPKNTVANVSLKRGADVTLISKFANEKAARVVDDFLTATIKELFDAKSQDRESVTPTGNLLALADNFRSGELVTIEFKLTQPMLREIVRGTVSAVMDAANANQVGRARRNAQNLASVSMSALAAGATLDPKATTEEAIRTVCIGVNGAESFKDTTFQVPGLTDADIAAAARHLKVDRDSGNLNYNPQPLTAAELRAKEKYANSPEGKKALGQRNAMNLASVWASAMATDADLSSAKSKRDAIALMINGVYGGGTFSDTIFQVPAMDAQTIAAASKYLEFDPANGELIYVDTDRQVQKKVSPKRMAINFATVGSSAWAAGSPDFKNAGDKMEAMQKLSEGVTGSGSFENVLFRVPNVDQQDMVAAGQYLRWDSDNGQLIYEGR